MAMAFGRTLVSKAQLTTFLSRAFTSVSGGLTITARSSTLIRFRPLVVLAEFRGSPSLTVGKRSFATRPTTSSLNDPSPNFSNRPPKETILLDGCDFEHWLVVVEKPPEEWTRDEIIDHYIKTLAQVVGSEEEARMKIYSVSTRCYFAFGALVSEEMSYKLKELEKVRWVLPDSYLDVRNKNYGGEPFIDGKAVPYDPKYHEEWIKNNARANDRSRRNDRPRNDRSRNFERRREIQQNRGPPGAPAMVGPPSNANTPNIGSMPPSTNAPNSPPYMGGGQPNPNMQYNAPNPNMPYNVPNPNMQYNAPNPPNPNMQYNASNPPNPNMPHNVPNPNMPHNVPNPNMQYNAPNPNNPNMQYNAPNPNMQYNAPNPNMQYNSPNMGGMPPRSAGYPNNAPHAGNMPNQDYHHAPNGGGAPYENREAPGAMPNRGFQNNGNAPGGNMGGPPSANQYQVRDVPGRDQDYQH